MNPIDIIILLAVAAAFIVVCVRAKRKGSCADCAQGDVCSGSCTPSKKNSCPATLGVDEIETRLRQGVK